MAAVILFASMIVLALLGVPIAMSMGIAAMLAIVYSGLDLLLIPSIMSGGISNYTLIAVPFFILLGNIMNSSGITRRIFDFAEALVGHIKGGLAQVNIVSSVIFAGISGTATADAAGLGLIEIKAMRDKGYDPGFSVGVTMASAMLGPIIPPSVTFLVFASLSSVSPGKLFIAGIIPGLLIAAALMITCYLVCSRGKVSAPAPEKFSAKKLFLTFKNGFFALITPLVLIWGISSGTTTATEAGTLGVVYCVFVSLIYRELTLKTFWKAIMDTVITSSIIMFIVGCGTVIGWVIAAERIPQMVAQFMLSVTDNKILILLFINLILLILGCFMDATSIQLIMVPILLPIANAIGVHPLTLGVLITINVMIGFATPPVGSGLFIMSSISGLSLEKILQGMKPFWLPLFLGLLAITYIPFFTTWLPGLLG